MGDAWTDATTDITPNVQTGCLDDAQMGAMTDIMYNVLMDGDFTSFSCRLTHFIKDLGYVLVVLNLSIPEINGADDSMMMSS